MNLGKELVKEKRLLIIYANTKLMIADGLTKPLQYFSGGMLGKV
jgi:hypothetical protein